MMWGYTFVYQTLLLFLSQIYTAPAPLDFDLSSENAPVEINKSIYTASAGGRHAHGNLPKLSNGRASAKSI